MKRNIALFFVVVFVSFCLLYGLQKREKLLKPLEYEVTVELVVVEVFVTDKKGNFVDNLTKDDFEIFEDGKRVEIQYFAVVKPEKETIKMEVAKEIREREKPLPPKKMKLVILFDNLNTNSFYLNSSWPKIKEMFQALSGKVEETMIMELNRYSGMRIIQPFTSDQNLFINKISKFRTNMWKEIDKEIRKSQIEELGKEARRSVEDRFIGNPEYIIWALKEEERFKKRERLSDSFSAFLAAVNYIRRFDGIKSVLIVSDGFPIGGDLVRIFDPFRLFGGKKYFNQREAFEKFLELINEEKLIFYAISPQPSVKRMSNAEQWSKELYSLEKITEETGGVYLKGAKRYQNFAKELGRDLTHFYDISYTPTKKTRKAGYHRIEVKVKKPGLTVRFRRGYSDFNEEQVERRNIASAFLSPSFFKDIGFFCNTDFVLKGRLPQFWIRMHIPLDQFRDFQDISPPENLAMMFGISEWAERKVHFGEIEIPIKDAIERDIKSLYYAFITSGVKLKPGEYETRVILRHAGDRIGGWKASLQIPEIEKEISLNIINSIFGFLRSEAKEKRIPFSLSKKDGCLILSQYRFYPSVGNIFKRGEEVALYMQVYNPKKTQDFSFQFSLTQDENMTLNLSSQQIESYFDKKLKISNEVYRLDFQDVFPGDYLLKIISSESNIEKEIEIKIIS
ncbi:MAG: VWA domain-containing protein [Candidatus Hydrothermarchaeota archaeon]